MSGAVDIKIPLEALSYRFRRLQKHLSREVEAEIEHIASLQDTFNEEKCAAIRNRLESLRSLTLSTDVIEKECLSKIRTRATAVAARSLSEEDRTIVLVADYLLRLREFGCVEHLVAEYGEGRLRPFLDIEEHREAHRVESAITTGDLETAVEWCQSHASKLRRIGSVLEFHLCQEAFLALVHGDHPQEALQYAQSHLAGLVSGGSDGNATAKPSQASAPPRVKEARPRAATLGTAPDRGPGTGTGVSAVPSFNEFIGGTVGGDRNNSNSAGSSDAGGVADGPSDLTHTMRHLTGLLVYPSASPEVRLHPRFGPTAKPDRLRYILQLFQIDFRRVYGYPERSPLETYLATGVAVLKTSACASTLHSRGDVSPSNAVAGSLRDGAAGQAYRRPRGVAAVGATLNRLLSGSSSSDNGEGSPPRGRSSGRIFSGLSNIGGFLTMSSRRSRSQSMSAVEEQISPVVSPTGRIAAEPVESVQQPAGLHRSHSNGDAMDSGSGLSHCAARALLDLNGNGRGTESIVTPPAPCTQEMPEHPCYHPSRRTPWSRLEFDPLSEGTRRSEQCPVCSLEGGVGPVVAGAVPCFPSPVSVLVCRGSGLVMTHENPPMALPNGQVFSRNFLLSTAVHRTVPVADRNDSIAGGIRTAARVLRPSFAREAIPTLPRRPPPPARGFPGREESRWSVLRRLAARSVARSTAPAAGETRIYSEDRWATSTLEPPLEPLQDTDDTHPGSASTSGTSRVELSRGPDGVLRSRSEATAAAPPLRVSPIRDSSRTEPFQHSPTRIYFQARSPVTAASVPMDISEQTVDDEDDSDDSSTNDDEEEGEDNDMDSESDGTMNEDIGAEDELRSGTESVGDDVYAEMEADLMSAREAIETREALHRWRDRRVASAERTTSRVDEAELSTGVSRTETADTTTTTAMEDGELGADAVEMMQFAVCPITGEHFEFCKLRTVFLA